MDKKEADIHSPSKLPESVHGRKIFEEAQRANDGRPTLPVIYTKWSDDFEPNSQSKQSRGSAWCCCIRFLTPYANAHSTNNTYVVAIGEKDLDHQEVEAEFNKEMQQLCFGRIRFFHAAFGGMVNCHVSLFAVLKDQPERRKSCGISLGNGQYAGRWGYSVDLASISKILPPCTVCHNYLLNREKPHTPSYCQVCANWDFGSPLIKYTPPEHFPPGAIDNEDGLLRPHKISFRVLTATVAMTISKYSSGEWSSKQCTAYLNVQGLNIDTINSIIASVDSGERWKYPATWSQVDDIAQMVDVLMHLLGLGIAKAVHRDLIRDWLMERKVLSSFKRNSYGKLEAIKALRLAWCKTLPAGKEGRLGGWVSENHFAWVRVARWYFADVSELVADTPYVQPDKPFNRWTVYELKEWLRSHQIPQGDAKRKDELSQKVALIMATPGGCPPPIGPKGGPAINVEQLLLSMSAMFAACMGPEECDHHLPEEVDRLVKIFLTAVEKLHAPLRGTNDKELWVAKYNFICLLNLKNMMWQFGMPHNLWEGGMQGEGVLRHLKPLVSGLYGRWAETAHLRYASSCAMIKVRKVYSSFVTTATDVNYAECAIGYIRELGGSEEDDDGHGYGMYRRYKNAAAVRSSFVSDSPISALLLGNGELYVVVSTAIGAVYYHLAKGAYQKNCCGLCYYGFVLNEVPCRVGGGTAIVDYCLLLPERFGQQVVDVVNQRNYAVVTSTWKELKSDGQFGYCSGMQPAQATN